MRFQIHNHLVLILMLFTISISSEKTAEGVDFLYVALTNDTVVRYDISQSSVSNIQNSMTTFATANLNNPIGLAFDSQGFMYAANYNNSLITKYNKSGQFVNTIGGTSGLQGLQGIAIDKFDNIYVTNAPLNTISKFNPIGNLDSTISSNLLSPEGITFDELGNLYAANWSNSTVSKYNQSGNYLSSISSNIFGPIGVAVNSKGHLYVANKSYLNNTISVFDQNGYFIKTIPSVYNNPSGISFDTSDNFYLTYDLLSTVSKFNSDGVFQYAWNTPSYARVAVTVPESSSFLYGAIIGGIITFIRLMKINNMSECLIIVFLRLPKCLICFVYNNYMKGQINFLNMIASIQTCCHNLRNIAYKAIFVLIFQLISSANFAQHSNAVDFILDLGQIVSGGDGRGNQFQGNESKNGIDVESGSFVSGYKAGHSYYNGYNPVINSPFIDGVFVLGGTQINSSGVQYRLQTNDGFYATYDYILNNKRPDGSGNLPFQNNNIIYSSGIGLHSGSGITFDIDAIRLSTGAAQLSFKSTFFNMGSNSKARAYVVLSDSNSIISEFYSPLLYAPMSTNWQDFSIAISPSTKYLTLMAGVGGDGINSDHCAFADAFVLVTVPEPSNFLLSVIILFFLWLRQLW